MFRPSILMAAAIAMISICYVHAAPASKSTFRLPCMIVYDEQTPISTNCLITVELSGDVMIEKVTTGNGRSFKIEKRNSAQWYLNHQTAIKISDEPNTCYQNRQVKVCF